MKAKILMGVLIFTILFSGCLSPNASEISKKVEELNYCEKDSDCTIVKAPCPLPCSFTVNTNEKTKAEQIISTFTNISNTCSACAAPTKAICENQKCKAVYN